MPLLTPTPNPISDKACVEWAAKQDEDAIDMWGIREDGESSRLIAIHRLAALCLGGGVPDIVGALSSAGAMDAYCEHQPPEVKLCQGPQ